MTVVLLQDRMVQTRPAIEAASQDERERFIAALAAAALARALSLYTQKHERPAAVAAATGRERPARRRR